MNGVEAKKLLLEEIFCELALFVGAAFGVEEAALVEPQLAREKPEFVVDEHVNCEDHAVVGGTRPGSLTGDDGFSIFGDDPFEAIGHAALAGAFSCDVLDGCPWRQRVCCAAASRRGRALSAGALVSSKRGLLCVILEGLVRVFWQDRDGELDLLFVDFL